VLTVLYVLNSWSLVGGEAQYRVSSAHSWRQEKLDHLKFWLGRNGATFPKIDVAVVATTLPNGSRVAGDDACGAFALDDIQAGEIIMFIPDHVMLTSSSVQLNEPVIRNMTEIALHTPMSKDQKLSQHGLLSVALLEQRQRHENSFFAPYIDTLPRSMKHLPVFYGEQEQHELAGTSLLRAIRSSRATIERQWKNVVRLEPAFATRHTLSDFMWAFGNVASRAFTKPMPKTEDTKTCVVPRILGPLHVNYVFCMCTVVCEQVSASRNIEWRI